jgi:hypothetical protein
MFCLPYRDSQNARHAQTALSHVDCVTRVFKSHSLPSDSQHIGVFIERAADTNSVSKKPECFRVFTRVHNFMAVMCYWMKAEEVCLVGNGFRQFCCNDVGVVLKYLNMFIIRILM